MVRVSPLATAFCRPWLPSSSASTARPIDCPARVAPWRVNAWRAARIGTCDLASIDAHDDARRPQAARMTNRVLLGSVNARLAPPSPSTFLPTRELWRKRAAAHDGGRAKVGAVGKNP